MDAKLVNILLKNGADTEIFDNNGLNALLWCCQHGFYKCFFFEISVMKDFNLFEVTCAKQWGREVVCYI